MAYTRNVNTALTASFTVVSYVATFCWSFFFLSWGIPYFSGSSARALATSSLAAASRSVSHAWSLAARRNVLLRYALRFPRASRLRMNVAILSGTCSSDGIV